MFDTLLVLLVGVVIGWHVPQPAWAKPIVDFVAGYVMPMLKPLLDRLLSVKAMLVGKKKK